ncbi:zinc-finger double domain-containing protein [Phthorimaea operculella]|nr:zinc-finger double domain-containing protein [Phthorimaea operculella]
MDESEAPLKYSYCFGCLCRNDSVLLEAVNVSPLLRTILQIDQLMLCYICKRIANHAEIFVQNVQSNQILLENMFSVTDSIIESINSAVQPIISLTHVPLQPILLDGVDTGQNETYEVYPCVNMKIKLELKCDNDYDTLDNDDHAFADFGDADNKLGLESFVKDEEDEYPLKLLKQELESQGVKIKCMKKIKKKVRRRDKITGQQPEVPLDETRIELICISREECLQERDQKALEETYQKSEYKCEDCVKSFSYKSSYEKHMECHDEINGDYVCDICNVRMSTEDKLHHHQRYHTHRYKCLECGLIRQNKITIEDHYRTKHCQGTEFTCPHCFKRFKRRGSLRKHMARLHGAKDKVVCADCNKIYANKESLKHHIIKFHTNEPGRRVKSHVCQDCGKAFSSPSQLQKHSIKHNDRKDHYCVECDKSFKSEYILKHHLKTTMSHNTYMDLPLPCLQCKKRFAIRRDLDRHMNRVHLNIKPFQCDQCEKGYVNNWSLKEHQRMVHEGYKRPLKYPCPMCDKIFDRQTILKSHIRTHTGERPYQCSKCPAAFSQAGILGTHVKLVHLKLTRDGRPKASVAGSKA